MEWTVLKPFSSFGIHSHSRLNFVTLLSFCSRSLNFLSLSLIPSKSLCHTPFSLLLLRLILWNIPSNSPLFTLVLLFLLFYFPYFLSLSPSCRGTRMTESDERTREKRLGLKRFQDNPFRRSFSLSPSLSPFSPTSDAIWTFEEKVKTKRERDRKTQPFRDPRHFQICPVWLDFFTLSSFLDSLLI